MRQDASYRTLRTTLCSPVWKSPLCCRAEVTECAHFCGLRTACALAGITWGCCRFFGEFGIYEHSGDDLQGHPVQEILAAENQERDFHRERGIFLQSRVACGVIPETMGQPPMKPVAMQWSCNGHSYDGQPDYCVSRGCVSVFICAFEMNRNVKAENFPRLKLMW